MQNVHNFYIKPSTSGFSPDERNRRVKVVVFSMGSGVTYGTLSTFKLGGRIVGKGDVVTF